MKLSLVVASGVHEGKAIPITTPQFVIGRDEQCQLRPASPAISKRHCALMVRGGQVFVRDFGSTNGTFVNGQLVEGEVELFDRDLLKVGPLEFRVGMEVSTVMSKPAAAKSAAAAKVAATPAKSPAPAAKPAAPEDDDVVAIGGPAEPTSGPPSDKIAELLLGGDDGAGAAKTANTLGNEAIPDGSTIMELPAAEKTGQQAKPKAVVGTGNTSEAAAEILKKYHRRPRN
ncbi:MAG TPA: FHA domain-containing protein [Gemmataceae bacterium]|nr:FHA domain-containing protein [Gemmataceae bacterium]